MDFTALMIHTGMTIKELKSIPKRALRSIIKSLEDRVYGTWMPEKDRDFIHYQIDCYNALMKTAK